MSESRLLLDMNMPRRWAQALSARGHDALMWRDAGDHRAMDSDIMAFAKAHDMVVITRDLDFGEILAATRAEKPSVVLVRARGAQLDSLVDPLLKALNDERETMQAGALMVIGPGGARIRLLPLPS